MKQKNYSTLFLGLLLSLVGVSAVYADTASTPVSNEKEPELVVVEEVTPAVPTYEFTLIYNDTVVLHEFEEMKEQQFTYALTDGTTGTATTTGNDALSLLLTADLSSDVFEVTQITQYSFGSYVACMNIQGEEACEDWQYLVNNAYSFSSIDQQSIGEGDELLMYFGSQYAISIDNSDVITVQDDIQATIQEYNPQTPGYEPLQNATLALLESSVAASSLATGITDEQGQTTFSAPTTEGTYYIGFDQGGYYWPTQEVQILPIPKQNVTLRIETADSTLFSEEVAMPESCSVIDTTTTTPHEFAGFNAICALQEATDKKILSSYQVTDWGFAFAIDQINDIANATDWSETWLVYHNNEAPDGGINTFSLEEGDELLLTYGPWPMSPLVFDVATTTLSVNTTSTISITTFGTSTPLSSTTTLYIGDSEVTSDTGTFLWKPTKTGTIELFAESDGFTRTPVTSFVITEEGTTTEPEEPAPTGGSGGGGCSSCGSSTNTQVDTVVKNIIAFLDASQNEDGSFGSSISFSDWTALAYNAYTGSAAGKDALKAYLLTDPDPRDGFNDTASYAKRAMVLMSYGIDPYTDTQTNYIQKILDGFDGTQFGIEGIVNDDIFALMPLLHAGYTSADPMIVSSTKYILSQQHADGSFESKDLTGAALQILPALTNVTGVTEAIAKAKNFVLNGQQTDGGFGDIYATPWIMQGLSALGEDISILKKNNLSPIDYVKANQETDGGIGETTNSLRLWTSAWAVPALLEKPWPTLLSSFSKPAETPTSGGGSAISDDETATSTEDVIEEETTTSTEVIAEPTETVEETPEVTILPISTTEAAPTLYAAPVIEEQTVQPEVAGVKITEENTPEEITSETKEQEPATDTATDTNEQSETEPAPEGTKPVHVAFGTTILLGLLLGWRFLRTLL